MVAFETTTEKSDWDLSTASVVLLGAGFSAAATNGALPTMSGFFHGLNVGRYSLLRRFVLDVEESLEEANVERVLVALDQICTSPVSMFCDPLSIEWRSKRTEIRRSLEDYVLERLAPCEKLDRSNWALQLLASCSLSTTVVSMNYDNIAERVLSNRSNVRHGDRNPTCPHCKMRLMMQKACSCAGKLPLTRNDWQGAVVKPHGSIAWRRCLNDDCCEYNCLVADRHCKPFGPCKCPSCNGDCGPVVVLPSMTKNLEEIPTIGTMWKVLHHAIEEATSILVFGFSFPQSDELLHYFFKKALAANPNHLDCAIIDLNPRAVAMRLASAFPASSDVTMHVFPVEIGKEPTWLQAQSA